MSSLSTETAKIPDKFQDNVILFLCRGNERKKVRFGKRDAVANFKYKVW